MDPAVYARAFGVQSEANKVTVTRVACSEILYRRVVNTYRRDMNSTVTHLRREQKKLRRCMRGYRKKLHGDDKKKSKPYKFGWIANTSPDDDGYIGDQNNSWRKKSPKDQTLHASGKPSHLREEKGNVSEARNFTRYDPLQSQVDAFLKAPNMKPRKKSERLADTGNKNKNGRGGKERRRFVIGSGKIQSSKRMVDDVFHGDDGADSYSLLSDSSDDERSPVDPDEATVDMHKPYESRLRDAKRGLIRANSVYFKAINASDDDGLDPVQSVVDTNMPPNNNDQDSGDANVQNVSNNSTHDALTAQDLRPKIEGKATDPLSRTWLPSLLPITHIEDTDDLLEKEGGAQTGTGKEIPTTLRSKSNHRKGVSFGDIAKLQHGLKTKKLFSLVDQLAARHGIVGDVNLTDKSRQLPVNKSFNNRSFYRNSHGDQSNSLTTYSSVFYNIKYGYDHDTTESPKEPDTSRSSTLKARNERLITHLSAADSGLESELTQTLSTRLSHADINESKFDESSNEMNNDSSLLLPQNVSKKNSSLSGGTYDTVATPWLAPDEVDSSRSVQELQALQTSQRRRDSRLLRQRRKSSMLEASQYVNSLRNKDASKKMSFSNSRGSFDKRKDSVMSGDDSDMMPDINKVSWSSALSRMKLVHTLVDLTHII